MIVTLVVVVLACLAGLAVLRPFTVGRSGALHADVDADEDLRRALLRQLRDLDDDLAGGKLTAEEHRALRAPVETQAIAVLRRIERRVGSGELTTGLREIRPAEKPAAAPPGRRRLRLALGSASGVVGLGGVVALLGNTVNPRGSDATITGGVAAQGAPGGAGDPVAAAQARVKQNPQDVAAHLDLAEAYVTAGKPNEAAIEYLAVTQIQPNNAAANTGLALLAFEAGHAPDAKKMVDKVLVAQPKYPEALYARGLIELMGLGQPAPAEHDLKAYLAAAPFGSHKSTVQTLLAMIAAAPSK
jgi:tetratricopeptide (TPR) repeat protein